MEAASSSSNPRDHLKRKIEEASSSSSNPRDRLKRKIEELDTKNPHPGDLAPTAGMPDLIACSTYTSYMLDALGLLDSFRSLPRAVLLEKLYNSHNAREWQNGLWEIHEAHPQALALALADKLEPLVDADDLSKVEQGFEGEYMDPGGNIVAYVMDFIDLCYQNWSCSPGSWYAPCTAVVQSSGWGKSRVFREIAMRENGVIVLYFSLANPAHRGYPKCNPEIYKLFTDLTSVEQAYALIGACFSWIFEQESLSQKQDIFLQHQKFRNYEGFLSHCRSKQHGSAEWMREVLKKALDKHNQLLRKKGVTFLFVFDEARALLPTDEQKRGRKDSPFVFLRRASSELPSEGCTFFILIDTQSRVADFTPSNWYDPSMRVFDKSKSLFPPICRIPSFDLPWISVHGVTLDEVAAPEVLFKQGRPLWAALDFAKWDENIVLFALRKLLNGASPDSESGKLLLGTPIASLALLGRRIAVDVCPQSYIADSIVAGHMGVCVYVTFLREAVLCATLPEPVLSEAAAYYYRRDPNTLLKHLNSLNTSLLNGIVSAGERGELVARFLLIHVMDNLQGDSAPFTKPVHLHAFLQKAFPRFDQFADEYEHLNQAKVFFNAFHRFFGEPSVPDLRTFLRKCAAIVCQRNQPRFDLIIPYVLPDANGSYNLDDDNCVGCIAIQVRNRRTIRDIDTTVEKMTSQANLQPGFFILLHLTTEPKSKHGDVRDDGVLLVCGLDEINVDECQRTVVEQLLLEFPNALELLHSEYEEYAGEYPYRGMATKEARERESNALKTIFSSVMPH